MRHENIREGSRENAVVEVVVMGTLSLPVDLVSAYSGDVKDDVGELDKSISLEKSSFAMRRRSHPARVLRKSSLVPSGRKRTASCLRLHPK